MKILLFLIKMVKVYKNLLTTDVEVFLYNEGYLEWNKEAKAKLVSSLVNDPTTFKKMDKRTSN